MLASCLTGFAAVVVTTLVPPPPLVVCRAGYQEMERTCVPDRMAVYLRCLEGAGGGVVHLQRSAAGADRVRVDLSGAGGGLALRGDGKATVNLARPGEAIKRVSQLLAQSRAGEQCLGTALARAVPAGDPAPPAPRDPPRVKTARLETVDLTADRCPLSDPCVGLKRGDLLHVALTQSGYATVYLQEHGVFFNQGGRVISGEQDDVALSPNTTRGDARPVVALYIVTSGTRITGTQNASSLESLPRGERYGPIYLRVDEPPAEPAGRLVALGAER